MASDRDHVVAAVRGGIEYRLVFSHQCYCNLCSESSKRSLTGTNIYMVPGAAVGKASLLVISKIILSIERIVLTWPTTWDIVRARRLSAKSCLGISNRASLD